jgi:hypothetical protein
MRAITWFGISRFIRRVVYTSWHSLCARVGFHELAHAIDGHRELSSTAEWRRAWLAEIADGALLGDNSARSPHEGWGDFGMLSLGSGIPVSEIREVMPRAYGFWHTRGLL